MILECPACGKANDAAPKAACRRCGCDLSQLHAVMRSASWHISAALGCMQKGLWEDLLKHAERSWRFRHSEHSARLAFLAAAALGQTGRAARWHAAASGTPPEMIHY